MSFKDFVHDYNLKNEATSNIKIYELLSYLSLSDVRINLGDGPFKSDIVILNSQPSEETHWVVYLNENYFDSYGCSPPNKLSEYTIKQNGHCLSSEFKLQGLTKKGIVVVQVFVYI